MRGLEIRKQGDGGFLVVLSPEEAALLQSLPDHLRRLFADPGAGGPLLARLFPRAYQDPTQEAEYRRLLGSDLLERKQAAIAAFAGTLLRAKRTKKQVEITIRPEEFDLWLGFVNDMRLVLATALDFEDESFSRPPEDYGPQAGEAALLYYLTGLEEVLIAAARRAE